MKGLFVTGTDTGVGKTVVAASVLAYLRKTRTAIPMKPVQTGGSYVSDQWHAPDLDFALRAAGFMLKPDEYRLACPYCFRDPCSPHLAARLAHRPISMRRIVKATRDLNRRYEFLVVEGAGGVLTPLTSTASMLDLMVALKLPALVVARAGLGTLNHTFLTLRALHDAGISILGVTLWAPKWGFIERNNLHTIRQRTRLMVVKFPHCAGAGSGALSPKDLSMAERALRPILDPWALSML
jgi:dethiobiotin synthetase